MLGLSPNLPHLTVSQVRGQMAPFAGNSRVLSRDGAFHGSVLLDLPWQKHVVDQIGRLIALGGLPPEQESPAAAIPSSPAKAKAA